MKLYHGTHIDNLDSIQADGLRTNSGTICFANSVDKVIQFMAINRTSPFAIFVVDTEEIGSNPDPWVDGSLSADGSCYVYRQDIPSKFITLEDMREFVR